MKTKIKMIGTPLSFTALVVILLFSACSGSGSREQAGDTYEGVKLGAISYSWRSMPSTPEDIIAYCKQCGITTLELMGDVVETWAGAPSGPSSPGNFRELSEEERRALFEKRRENEQKVSEWRIQEATPEMYLPLRKMFDDAGIEIHIVKFAPAEWSDAEIDYAFESAKILGADGITNEISHEACQRLAPFAEKHGMYAIFHQHGQPGDSTFQFEDFLGYSPSIMLNFDAGHYFGATGKHPNGIIEKLHDRIYSIHLKDKTAKDGDPPDTNMPWGEGDTPIGEILSLIRDNQWDIYCDIELEYEVPEGSDAVRETAKIYKYCQQLLES